MNCGDCHPRDGQTHIVAGWEEMGALSIGAEEARDVLYALNSPELLFLFRPPAGVVTTLLFGRELR